MIAALLRRLADALTHWIHRPAVQPPPPRTFDEGVEALLAALKQQQNPDQPARDR